MHVDRIELSWFRGAGAAAALDTAQKSICIYGPNGAGKSTFVDAFEYLLKGGKIEHLSHEYSGKRQEKAVLNTHRPADGKCRIEITFAGNRKVSAHIPPNGAATFSGTDIIKGWDIGRLLLRQNEVSRFIHAAKGEKYSALLPLLGLTELENTAVNLRALAKAIQDIGRMGALRAEREALLTRFRECFGGKGKDAILAEVQRLHRKYVPNGPVTTDIMSGAAEIAAALDARIASLELENRRFFLLQGARRADCLKRFLSVQAEGSKAASAAQELVDEKLAILNDTVTYATKLTADIQITCPACGQEISSNEFKRHVTAEQARLSGVIAAFNARRRALGDLASALETMRASLNDKALESWRAENAQQDVLQALTKLAELDADALRNTITPEQQECLEQTLPKLTSWLDDALRRAPPGAQELVTHKDIIAVIASVDRIRELGERVTSLEALHSFVVEMEVQTRQEIKARSEALIAEISADMQRMWATLHPGEPIDEVRLYMPDDADKAIDIAVKFHGIAQPSPRLTLSEGHRNSLGLCVFLALAKRDPEQSRPIILDDVVTSFDREHRGQVADLLMKEFSGRQLILLTHDRDWYVELKFRLPHKEWNFCLLQPWSDPRTGVRVASSRSDFEEAKQLIAVSVNAAGNVTRAIMDVAMGIIAERLEVPMPFCRGDKNDRRSAVDFMQHLRSVGRKALRIRNGSEGNYPVDVP